MYILGCWAKQELCLVLFLVWTHCINIIYCPICSCLLSLIYSYVLVCISGNLMRSVRLQHHAMLRMVWPQPLTCGAPYSANIKHSLLLHPKEKEVDAFHGEGMFPSLSVIFSSSQPHHFSVVCMELSVPFKSPLIHRNYGNLFWHIHLLQQILLTWSSYWICSQP